MLVQNLAHLLSSVLLFFLRLWMHFLNLCHNNLTFWSLTSSLVIWLNFMVNINSNPHHMLSTHLTPIKTDMVEVLWLLGWSQKFRLNMKKIQQFSPYFQILTRFLNIYTLWIVIFSSKSISLRISNAFWNNAFFLIKTIFQGNNVKENLSNALSLSRMNYH